MAPKKNAAATAQPPPPSSIPPSVAKPSHGVTSASATPTKRPFSSSKSTNTTSLRNAQDAQDVLLGVWNRYVEQTPQRVKLIDVFMVFLVVVGALQFVYCVIAGNYVCSLPFFLSHPIPFSCLQIFVLIGVTSARSLSTLSCLGSQPLSVNSCSRPA